MMASVRLSTPCFRALEDAVTAACAELLRSPDRALLSDYEEWPPDVRTLVHDYVGDIVTSCLRAHNNGASSAARRLPPELLCSVFSYLDLANRITATHVCRAWRDVSLAAAGQLWSAISVHARPGILAARLARAFSVPLQLHIYVHPDNMAEICSCLTAAWDSIQTLFLRLDRRLKPAHTKALTTVLSKAAPALTEFALIDVAERVPGSAWADLLGGHSPLLRLLKVDLPQDALTITKSFDSVTHISLRLQRVTPRLLGWIFSSFPRLEACALELHSWEEEENAADVYQHPLSMKTFALRVTGDANGAAVPLIVPHLFHESIPNIVIDYFYDPEADMEDVAALVAALCPASQMQSATIHYSSGGMDALNATTHHSLGRQRTYFHVPLATTRAATLFDGLGTLTLSEMMWSLEHEMLAELPALQALKVYTLFPWSHMNPAWLPSVLLCDDDCNSVLRCPLLKHVTFSARQPQEEDFADDPYRNKFHRLPTVVAPSAIVRFLRRKLRYSAPKLGTVTFSGVELTTHLLCDVAHLLEMANEVVCDPVLFGDEAALGLDVFNLLDVDFHDIFGFRDPTRDSEGSYSDAESMVSDG